MQNKNTVINSLGDNSDGVIMDFECALSMCLRLCAHVTVILEHLHGAFAWSTIRRGCSTEGD